MYSSSKFLSRLAKFTTFLLALSLLAAATSDPQGTAESRKKEKPYALLFGTLWGADQRPVPGVTIKIRRSDQKKPKWTLISNSTGEFAQRVPPGKADYIVSADRKHKKGAQPVETTVHVENDERVDFGLHLTE